MKRIVRKVPACIGLWFLFFIFDCPWTGAEPSVLHKSQATSRQVRQAARAGQFYPGSPSDLRQMIDGFLQKAEDIDVGGDIIGMLVPHAGYEFSGQVAANAYRLIRGRRYDVVVIIGPSHYVGLEGASIGDWTAYSTPLGEASVDVPLVRRLKESSSLISMVPDAHRYEHSVEVQIPFIQTVLPGVPIVPIVIQGDIDYGKSEKIAKAIVKAAGDKNVLLVASSDMSHFPTYQDAYDVDLRMLDAVGTFDPKEILRLNYYLMQKGIQNLECVLCGPGALITVMTAAKELDARKVQILPYANSGDVSGERHRVVGYGSAVFYTKSKKTSRGGNGMMDEVAFSKEEKEKLFSIARKSISSALQKEPIPTFSPTESNLQLKRGVFVTLENKGQLRGCIGHFLADYPLYRIVSEMAVAAATQDYRFMYNPVTPGEMDDINIKISILSALKKVDSIDEIEVGKHGIWIRQDNRSGTYLPEVATELGWNKIEFLEHCCVEKAGLPRDAWKKGADIYIYSSTILNEKDL